MRSIAVIFDALCAEVIHLRELHDEEGFQIALYDKELKEVRKTMKDILKDNEFYHKENEMLKKACKDKDAKIAQLAEWVKALQDNCSKSVCRRLNEMMEDKHGND